jgi:BirA family biotin operon repressor/biotin-[acetyl-CoA-carboxylase] ligase
VSPQKPPRPAPGGHWTDVNQDSIVLGLLLESDDEFVKGEVLCDKLDVPRAELLKRIDSLRTRGYVIDASGGRGYRLGALPDGISEAEIAPLLSTSDLGRRIHSFAEVASTNDEAHRLADHADAEHGEVVIADVQTHGRGRRGRSWVAPAGRALTFSIILRPAISPALAPEITLVAAVAVCEAARELGAGDARIKWPNDIECGGRKLAGLLTELRADPERVRYAILGVGLNVSAQPGDFPEGLRATSLRIERGGFSVARPLACARVLEHLEEWLVLHETEGFGPVRERWRELSSTLGRRVRVEGPVPLEGEAVDLADDGALLVRTDAGATERVVAGDIEHCKIL